jgi:ankyrin repeat protein
MDENLSLDILYGDEYVPEELYQLVRHGLCSQLDIRLHELSHSIEYITALRWYNQEQLSLLMVAALNGYDNIVRVLLTHCDPMHHIELKGQITVSNGICIEGATALYCACYRGHFTVAKTLIELGHANPNADTYDYPKCPLLIYATSMDRLDIVRFLIENRYSDVNETKSTDIDQCTALIWASHRGYPVLVKYLIKHGADVNYSCPSEYLTAQTPICCATLRGHVGSVRLLYNAGADTNIKNNSGETLLMTAVRHKYYSIIAFLLKQSINTIEDLELAICSLIDISSSNEKMTLTLELLKFTLRKRQSMHIQKVCIEPMAAYNYEQECQTVDELNAIKDDRYRIYIETLLIRERLFLSRKDIAIMKPLHAYGDMLVDKKEFDKCLEVWIHMFYLYQQMKLETILHRFVWLFCRMLTAKHIIPVERFLRVCQLIFEPSQMEDKTVTLGNALFLVIIATKVMIFSYLI